jgi:hypothetical protein
MKILLMPPQWEVFNCSERFRVLVAGRRFGKTFLALPELIRAAWAPGRLVRGSYLQTSQTHRLEAPLRI